MGHLAFDMADFKAPPVASASTAVPSAARPAGRPLFPFVITTIPASSRPVDARLINEAVADATRPAVSGDDVLAASDGGDTAAADTADGRSGVADPVVTAHEQRIAVLKARIEALHTAHAATPMVADLHLRLQRAEAAHRLALARIGGSVGKPLVLADLGVGLPRPAVRPRLAALASTAHPREPITFHYRLRRAFMVSNATAGVPHAGSRTRAGSRLMVRTDIRDRSAGRLAVARRSLTAARKLLEDKPIAVRHDIHLASLWRWTGSEMWLLTPGRTDRT